VSRPWWKRWGHGALLLAVVLYSLFPIYFITVQSIKTAEEDVFGHPLWVTDPTFENYTELFAGEEARVRGYVIIPRVPFLLWVLNSASPACWPPMRWDACNPRAGGGGAEGCSPPM
jgi:ABC-type glycerol-3-phosphate transport system permease component